MQFRWNGRDVNVHVIPLEGNRFRVQVGEWEAEVDEVRQEQGRLAFRVGNRWYTLAVAATPEGVWVAHEGRVWFLEAARRRKQARRSGGSGVSGDGFLRAPVPAQVREIRVREGDLVSQGQVVVILEAMKMEFRLQAPFDGIVVRVAAEPGQVLERDAVVVELRPVSAEEAG